MDDLPARRRRRRARLVAAGAARFRRISSRRLEACRWLVRRASASTARRLGVRAPPAAAAATALRRSQELRTCSDKLVLSLEDDAPLRGDRAVFLIDIMNPCWIWPAPISTRVTAIAARVGQLPFNFQIGEDVKKIRLRPPATADGELEVRLDGCDGELIARLPLAPAVAEPGGDRAAGDDAQPRSRTPRPLLHVHRPRHRPDLGDRLGRARRGGHDGVDAATPHAARAALRLGAAARRGARPGVRRAACWATASRSIRLDGVLHAPCDGEIDLGRTDRRTR